MFKQKSLAMAFIALFLFSLPALSRAQGSNRRPVQRTTAQSLEQLKTVWQEWKPFQQVTGTPAIWTFHSGGGNQTKVTVQPDGTIFANRQTQEVLNYHSQTFSGDSSIEFEVDDRIFFGFYVLDATSGWVKAEITNARLTSGTLQQIEAEVATGLRRNLPPNSTLRIDIHGGELDYFINGQFWMRGFIRPTPSSFILRASFISVQCDPLDFDQAFLRVRVRPYGAGAVITPPKVIKSPTKRDRIATDQ